MTKVVWWHIFLCKNFCWRNKFFGELFLMGNFFLVNKVFSANKFLVKRKFCEKSFLVKKSFLVQKSFLVKKKKWWKKFFGEIGFLLKKDGSDTSCLVREKCFVEFFVLLKFSLGGKLFDEKRFLVKKKYYSLLSILSLLSLLSLLWLLSLLSQLSLLLL